MNADLAKEAARTVTDMQKAYELSHASDDIKSLPLRLKIWYKITKKRQADRQENKK